MINLEDVLKKEFPNKEIVRLKDITTKIAVISKVRIGNNRTVTDYDEISLNNIDEYGIIYVPQDSKEVGPAYSSSIESQSLKAGDLVVMHRGRVGKVGLVGTNYKRTVVGNNSMMRIQFPQDKKNETPRFVQAYLQLPYVKEYIDEQLSVSKDRKILTAAWLSELQIPLFEEGSGEFNDLVNTRLTILSEAKKIEDEAKKLIQIFESMRHECVELEINKKDKLEVIKNKDKDLKKLLDIAIDNIDEIKKFLK